MHSEVKNGGEISGGFCSTKSMGRELESKAKVEKEVKIWSDCHQLITSLSIPGKGSCSTCDVDMRGKVAGNMGEGTDPSLMVFICPVRDADLIHHASSQHESICWLGYRKT